MKGYLHILDGSSFTQVSDLINAYSSNLLISQTEISSTRAKGFLFNLIGSEMRMDHVRIDSIDGNPDSSIF